LAYSSSPPSLHAGLRNLRGQYAAAPTAAERAPLATAAEGLIAASNAVNAAGILTALAILLISLVRVRGVFSRGIAYLGVLAGAVGIVSEVFRDALGPGYYVYGRSSRPGLVRSVGNSIGWVGVARTRP
jgi:hypothetical protein